jgi:hypothetical protein
LNVVPLPSAIDTDAAEVDCCAGALPDTEGRAALPLDKVLARLVLLESRGATADYAFA